MAGSGRNWHRQTGGPLSVCASFSRLPAIRRWQPGSFGHFLLLLRPGLWPPMCYHPRRVLAQGGCRLSSLSLPESHVRGSAGLALPQLPGPVAGQSQGKLGNLWMGRARAWPRPWTGPQADAPGLAAQAGPANQKAGAGPAVPPGSAGPREAPPLGWLWQSAAG